jgi:Spy/CpxP family protein refolding chaperone
VKRWWLVIALLLSLGVNLGILAAVAARRPPKPAPEPPPREEAFPGPGPEGPPPRVTRLADRLGLEGEQRRRFVALQLRFFADTVRLRTQQLETYRALRQEMTAREPDRARIQSLLQESARLHRALEQAMVRDVIASREVLDPEQERLYLEIISRLRPPGARPGGPDVEDQRPPRRRPRWQPPWNRPPRPEGPGGPDDGPGFEEPEPPPP